MAAVPSLTINESVSARIDCVRGKSTVVHGATDRDGGGTESVQPLCDEGTKMVGQECFCCERQMGSVLLDGTKRHNYCCPASGNLGTDLRRRQTA